MRVQEVFFHFDVVDVINRNVTKFDSLILHIVLILYEFIYSLLHSIYSLIGSATGARPIWPDPTLQWIWASVEFSGPVRLSEKIRQNTVAAGCVRKKYCSG